MLLLQASRCFVLDLDQRAFLAAAKDRHAAGLPPVPPTPHLDPATDTRSRSSNGPIVVDPATFFGSSTSSGFSNTSWPVGRHVLDFFWGELALSEGAPFECLTPDGKSTVSAASTAAAVSAAAKLAGDVPATDTNYDLSASVHVLSASC